MEFEAMTKSPFMDSMDSTYGYMDSYLQDSPNLMAFNVPSSPSPSADVNALQLGGSMPSDYTFEPQTATVFPIPQRPYTPPNGVSISPHLMSSYNLSNADLSSDGTTSGRRSRGSGSQSPTLIDAEARIPRSQRFTPIVPPSSRPQQRAQRRRRTQDITDDDDDDFLPTKGATIPASASAEDRREIIRKQRIESEQRRRDELRDGYSRLKDTLPQTNQKTSKVFLLERATSHLKYLETVKDQLEHRLLDAENEVRRLRSINEALMLGTTERRVSVTSLPAF